MGEKKERVGGKWRVNVWMCVTCGKESRLELPFLVKRIHRERERDRVISRELRLQFRVYYVFFSSFSFRFLQLIKIQLNLAILT